MTKIWAWLKKHGGVIFSVFLLLLASFMSLSKTFQNDTYNAITNGNYILQHGIDDKDHFTIHDNLRFVKFRWGFDVVTAILYDIGGFTAVYISTLIFVALIGLSIYFYAYKKTKSLFVAFFAGLIMIIVGVDYIVTRAQTLSYLLLFFELICMRSFVKNHRPIMLALIALIGMLLLSVHASVWIVFMALFVPGLIELFIRKQYKGFAMLAGALAAIIAISLLSPLGIMPYVYPFQIMGDTISHRIISELATTPLQEIIPLLVFSSIALVELIIARRKQACSIYDILTVFGITVFGAIAKRNYITAVLLLIPIFVDVVAARLIPLRRHERLNEYALYTSYLALIILAAGVVTQTVIKAPSRLAEEYVSQKNFPVGASDYIIENLDLKTLRMYDFFDYGAYLNFRGIPTFIDSRSEIYEDYFSDTNIFVDYYNVEYGSYDNFRSLILKYKLNYVICNRYGGMDFHLTKTNYVENVYKDDYFAVWKIKE
jgi:hypothetical protein